MCRAARGVRECVLGLLHEDGATTIVVVVEILASARRHGISDDDIRHAVENALAGSPVDAQTDFMMLVGPDQAGNMVDKDFQSLPDGGDPLGFINGKNLISLHIFLQQFYIAGTEYFARQDVVAGYKLIPF